MKYAYVDKEIRKHEDKISTRRRILKNYKK
jgi:hypothetical protein